MMDNLTKEKILETALEFLADTSTFESVGDDNWLKAVLFYNIGINDFARALIRELEGNNG